MSFNKPQKIESDIRANQARQEFSRDELVKMFVTRYDDRMFARIAEPLYRERQMKLGMMPEHILAWEGYEIAVSSDYYQKI